MHKITLANGTIYPCDWCGTGSRRLYINLTGDYAVADLAKAFSDKAATAEITFAYGEMQSTYQGFTRLAAVARDGWSEGATMITLEKEVDGDE